MNRRRDMEDPVLIEHVKGRLAHIMAENAPRRAAPDSSAVSVGRAAGPPAFEPSEDDWDAPDVPDADRAEPDRADPRPRPAGFRRAHLAVVVAVLLVGLFWAGWAVLRARPVALASTQLVAPSVTTPRPRATGASGSATPVVTIMVHVLGAVRKPGVVSLPERSRVRDAIDAAGGLARPADPGDLNLAQILADGQQIVIGTKKRPSGDVRDGGGGGSDQSSPGPGKGVGVVNLNTATDSELQQLPGVGPVTAGKIIDWRGEHGRFSRPEELQEIDGIGPKTYAQIAPHVRV